MKFSYTDMRKRKQRRNVSSFASLLATPSDSNFSMPANGRIAVDATGSILNGAGLLHLTGVSERIITASGAMQTGDRRIIGYVEKGVALTLQANTVILLDVGFGKWQSIGELA